jgi:hypothetical protein
MKLQSEAVSLEKYLFNLIAVQVTAKPNVLLVICDDLNGYVNVLRLESPQSYTTNPTGEITP